MALIKCSECGKEISSKAKACPHCGNPIEEEIKEEKKIKEKNITCPECGAKNENGSVFCEKCGQKLGNSDNSKCPKCGAKNKNGTVFCQKCGNKMNANPFYCPSCGFKNTEEDIFCENCGTKLSTGKKGDWDFDNKLLTITFILTAIFGTFIFSSSGARHLLNFFDEIFLFRGEFLGLITLIIGSVVLIHMFIKDGFNLERDLDNLKHFKLTKFHVGIMFIISSLFLFLQIGPSSKSPSLYILPILILMSSFLICCSTTIMMNWSKLGWIHQSFTLLLSIGFFTLAIFLFSYGNEQNNDIGSQLHSLYESGRTNPGDQYITFGFVSLIVAIIFLVLFIITLVKGKKEN